MHELSSSDGMSNEELGGTPSRGPPPLPRALGWWYQFVGKRNGMLCHQNYFLDPMRLEVGPDGMMEFFCENQGVYLWATMSAEPERQEGSPYQLFLFEDCVEPPRPRAKPDDPPVWGRLNEKGKPWIEEGAKLSEFLIQVCLFESFGAAPYGAFATWVDEHGIEKVINPLKELQLPPWHWPHFPTRFFYGSGAFAAIWPNGEWDGKLGYFVCVGAKTEHTLAYLKEIIDEGWEFVSEDLMEFLLTLK